jgi:hypothetical protein
MERAMSVEGDRIRQALVDLKAQFREVDKKVEASYKLLKDGIDRQEIPGPFANELLTLIGEAAALGDQIVTDDPDEVPPPAPEPTPEGGTPT